MDLSKPAQDVLVSDRFMPCTEGYLIPSFLADQIGSTVKEAEVYLRELEHAGFLELQDPRRFGDSTESHYQTTVKGWFESEALRRGLRLRRPALVDQRNYQIEDLVLALMFEPHAVNNRLKGGMVGMSSQIPLLSIFVRLSAWSEEDIRAACKKLAEGRFLQYRLLRRHQKELEAVELMQLGKKRYLEEVRQRLHLADGECILDSPPDMLKVFFAWQSECKPARNALFAMLPELVTSMNARTDLLRKIDLVQATELGEGALRIDVALEEKIRAADYFIGDLTPVYTYKGRLRVNENVLVEVGFALASKPSNRIILVAMQDVVVDGDGSPNPQPAFDIGHVRRLQFKTKADGLGKLRAEFEAMLKSDGWFAGAS